MAALTSIRGSPSGRMASLSPYPTCSEAKPGSGDGDAGYGRIGFEGEDLDSADLPAADPRDPSDGRPVGMAEPPGGREVVGVRLARATAVRHPSGRPLHRSEAPCRAGQG